MELSAKVGAHSLVRAETFRIDEVTTEYEIRANLLAPEIVQNELAHTKDFVVALQKESFQDLLQPSGKLPTPRHARDVVRVTVPDVRTEERQPPEIAIAQHVRKVPMHQGDPVPGDEPQQSRQPRPVKTAQIQARRFDPSFLERCAFIATFRANEKRIKEAVMELKGARQANDLLFQGAEFYCGI